ncbi:putative RNA-directed DNA polymerase, eukaryota, reverse transcriptase zinc-binding domain protein [Tanacetum coccineum]
MLKADRKVLFCSFIYASNSYKTCRELWQNLCMHKLFVNGRAWALLGDFNSSIFIEDTYYGSSKINISMREFNDCVESVEILDVNCTGLHYTWNQKPNGDYGILKKIDRVMANLGFAGDFPGSYAVFQSYRISDHAPAVLKIRKISYDKPKPFKFFNFLSYKPEFLQVVKDQWGTNVNGHNMFRLVKQLRGLKKPLHAQGNIHERVNRLRHELDEVQKELDINPSSCSLRDEEAAYLNAFTQATLDEKRYLKQKAKIEWLRVGDTNSGYFHRSGKAKVSLSRIDCVTGHDNVLYEGKDVPSIFVDHYKVFLGSEDSVANMNGDGLFMNKIHTDKALFMVSQVTNDEIKGAIFNIENDKAPGPDGFTSMFFKKAWDIMGEDVCNAVNDFFSNRQILQEINHTIIALLPKVSTPSWINDYHPISCCNVIYKCISKIITNQIKDGLDDVVSMNQSAFIPGRSISDNIILTQELMHN